MVITKNFIDIIESLKDVYTRAINGELDEKSVEKWITVAEENITDIRGHLSNNLLNVSKKKQLQSLLGHILSIQKKLKNILEPDVNICWSDITSAFKNRIKSGIITNLTHVDVKSFLNDAFTLFEAQVQKSLLELDSLKVYTSLAAEFKINRNDEDLIDMKYFNTKSNIIFKSTNLQDWFNENVIEQIINDIEDFEGKESGWSLHSLIHLEVNINKLNAMRGSSYLPLPEQIKKKHACVNVKNRDDKCFMWAVLSALHPIEKNPDRVSHYKKFEKELNFKDIEFPVSVRNIRKFEKLNNISINLYMLKLKKKKIQRLTCSRRR